MPVRLLCRRKRGIQLLRDDVLDACHPRIGCVAIEQHALREVFVHLIAIVMGLDLHRRIVFRRMEAVEIERDLLNRRLGLHQVRA